MSNVTDWISAGANVAMAVTAFAAFWMGRNYLANLTNNDAYKLAFEIKNEIIPRTRHKLLFTNFYRHIKNDLITMSESDSIKRDEIISTLERTKVLYNKYVDYNNDVNILNEYLDKLYAYGWGSVDKKIIEFANIIANNYRVSKLCSEFHEEIKILEGLILNDDNYKLESEGLLSLIEKLDDISLSAKFLNKNHKEYFEGDSYIGMFFQRIKS